MIRRALMNAFASTAMVIGVLATTGPAMRAGGTIGPAMVFGYRAHMAV
jgi:hypothetical protein